MFASLLTLLGKLRSLYWVWDTRLLHSAASVAFTAIFGLRGNDTCSPIAPDALRETYIYKPLISPQDIRVLELLPAQSPTASICCKLHQTCLTPPALQYTAISYAWGSQDAPKAVIDCDGYAAHIPHTLYSALRRLRNSKGASLYLWADAICIDQSETTEGNTEKARQVQMMHQIFSMAEEVIVDLGELDKDEIEVLEVLDQYQTISEAKWSVILQSPGLVELFRNLRELDLQPPHSSFWIRFSAFGSRPWYTRVWVVQEFVLAQRVRFMIGDSFHEEKFMQNGIIRAFQHLSWLYTGNRTYASQVDLLPQLEQGLSDMADPANAMLHMLNLRNRQHHGESGTFCEQLDATTALFKATDPRDKAYALLGLSSDQDIEKKLVVDYEESLPDLALRVSMYLVRQGFAVFPLYYSVGDRKGYVSWAMDLENAARDDLKQLVYASGGTRSKVFQACGQTPFRCRVSPVRPNALQVRGCIVDEVKSVMSTNLITRGELKGPAHLREQSQWLNKALEWMLSVAPTQSLPEEAFIEQCWRTTIADLIKGHGQEGRGIVRLRDWPHSTRCISTWRMLHRDNYNKMAQTAGPMPTEQLPPSSTAVDRQPTPPPGTDSDIRALPEDLTQAAPLTPTAQQAPTSSAVEEQPTLPLDSISDVRVFAESLAFSLGRKLGLTSTNKASCLLPRDAQGGDLVVVLQGCQIPFILRRKTDEKGEYFRIVGCAYVNGVMDGEALDDAGVLMRDIEIC